MARQKGPRAWTRPARTSGSGGGAATVVDAPEAPAPKKRTNPAQFAREVRAEARKITWTSRKETWITSVMVFIMVTVAVVFFAVVDLALGSAVKTLISLG